MPAVTRTAIVAQTPERMFALVDAVEDYPRFLPWCSAAEVHHRDAATTEATLRIDYRGISQSFTTRNSKRAPQEIAIALVRGPFRRLDGGWHFTALGTAACKIELRLDYEFASGLIGRLVGPVFGQIAATLVDAFVRRAEEGPEPGAGRIE